ncbi:MAG: 30S ribosomal protein S4 [Candidatus ainarchaeum sp.]|nr:30S ribosomal protein S4 [Candidatus ainarchaeum sp.]MDD5096615.1 30S ribosomal protein S4 [Candidatus ainarchaeum sp.]
MGDPRKFSNKYERPMRLWDLDRLKDEKGLKRTYGLKNMRELWVMTQHLKKARRDARRLLSLSEEERARDIGKLMNKLHKLGIIPKEAKLEDILSLTVKDVLERRLQTRVVRKGLAKTMAQSRQLITHGFISIGGRRISAPSYLVTSDEEERISYTRPIDLEPPAPVEEAKEEEKAEEKAEEKPAEAAA